MLSFLLYDDCVTRKIDEMYIRFCKKFVELNIKNKIKIYYVNDALLFARFLSNCVEPKRNLCDLEGPIKSKCKFLATYDLMYMCFDVNKNLLYGNILNESISRVAIYKMHMHFENFTKKITPY